MIQTPRKMFHFEKIRTAKEHVDNYHIFNISGVWGRTFARSSNIGMSYLKQRFTFFFSLHERHGDILEVLMRSLKPNFAHIFLCVEK